jgi:hypothetical protein
MGGWVKDVKDEDGIKYQPDLLGQAPWDEPSRGRICSKEGRKNSYEERLQVARMTYLFIDGFNFSHLLHVEANK